MKRIATILVGFILYVVAVSAQNKGDMSIAASIGTSFGFQETKTYVLPNWITERTPLNTTVNGMAEFSYFLVDNVRLALSLGVPYNSIPFTKSEGEWLIVNTLGLQINPNIAYYVRLADKLYYTPEIGFSYELGRYSTEITKSVSYNENYHGWSVYANFLSFEFKVAPKFAIGAGIGSVAYAVATVHDSTNDVDSTTKQFQFNLNSSTVFVRFYL